MAKVTSHKGPPYVARITWNIDGWTRPSGARTKERGYVSEHGFGHEEWLARRDCEIKGWRYGFLQGVKRQTKRLVGKDLHILLYTIHPSGERLYVGELRSAQIIDQAERVSVLKIFKRKGLLKTMKQEVADAGGTRFAPGVNIRFRPDALKIYKTPLPVPRWDRAFRFPRYTMLQADGRVAVWWASLSTKKRPWITPPSIDPVMYKRAAQIVKMERIEAKMQREIKVILERRFGKGAVEAERDRRDLTVEAYGRRVFIELKASKNAKLAIREALGQLLEYAHFNTPKKSPELFIIAQGSLTATVRHYLGHLKRKFGLQIKYVQYQVGSNKLSRI